MNLRVMKILVCSYYHGSHLVRAALGILVVLLLALLVMVISGCASLPSVQHCDEIDGTYARKGNRIKGAVKFDCVVPVGDSSPLGAVMSVVK